MLVISSRSTGRHWRVSTCPSSFTSGLTWCLASDREAAKLWQLTMVQYCSQQISSTSATHQNSHLSHSLSVFHPLTYEGGIDCDRYQRKSLKSFYTNSFFSIIWPNFSLWHLSAKHPGPRREDRHADTDPGVRSDAHAAVQQPPPSEDHATVSQHHPELQHQLPSQWAVSMWVTQPYISIHQLIMSNPWKDVKMCIYQQRTGYLATCADMTLKKW